MNSNIDFNEIRVFTRVAEAGSFTAASRLLGIPKSTVSRRIALLEARLGIQLLTRTTRQLKLTETGEQYFQHCRKALMDIEEAELAISGEQSIPRGTLRIAAPVDFGVLILPTLLREFLTAFPAIRIQLRLSDEVVDLVKENIDLTFRAGPLEDSGLVSKKLGNAELRLFASARYLRKHPAPDRPEDLRNHAGLVFGDSSEHALWALFGNGRRSLARIRSVLGSDNLLALRAACLEGLGIALLPPFLCRDQIRSGKLIPVLPQWSGTESGFYAVMPARRHQPPRVRAFLEFISANRGALPWDSEPEKISKLSKSRS